MKRFDQINVIPFIDIMLVMLAIVLTTASFIAQGVIEVDLPQASNTNPPINENSIEISISAAHDYYFGEIPVTIKSLRQRLATVETRTSIILRVDKEVNFGKFIAVIDLLKSNNLENLSIRTREAHESS